MLCQRFRESLHRYDQCCIRMVYRFQAAAVKCLILIGYCSRQSLMAPPLKTFFSTNPRPTPQRCLPSILRVPKLYSCYAWNIYAITLLRNESQSTALVCYKAVCARACARVFFSIQHNQCRLSVFVKLTSLNFKLKYSFNESASYDSR